MAESRARLFSIVASTVDSDGQLTANALAAGVGGGGGASVTISDSIGSLPASADAGSFYYLTGTAKLYVYTGTNWVALDTTGIPSGSATNQSPTFNGTYYNAYNVSPYGSTITFNANGSDPEGDSLAYDYILSDPDNIVTNISTNGSVYTIETDSTITTPTSAQLTIRATDGNTYVTDDIDINLAFTVKNIQNLQMQNHTLGAGNTYYGNDFKYQWLAPQSWRMSNLTNTTSNSFGASVALWHKDSNVYDIIVGAPYIDSDNGTSAYTNAGRAFWIKKSSGDGTWLQGIGKTDYDSAWSPRANNPYMQTLSLGDFSSSIDDFLEEDYFGWRVAAHDKYVAVSSSYARLTSDHNRGIVCMYKESDGTLVPQSMVRDETLWGGTQNTSQFGFNISVYEDKLAVLSNQTKPGTGLKGRVYFYKKGGGVQWDSVDGFWNPGNESFPTSNATGLHMSGNWCAVSNNIEDGTFTNDGVVYMYKESDGRWFHHSTIRPNITYAASVRNDYPSFTENATWNGTTDPWNYGSAVKLDTSTTRPRLAVSANNYNGGRGAIQVLEYFADSDEWYITGDMLSSISGGYAGTQIGFSKDVIVSGVPYYVNGGVNYGATQYFQKTSNGWVSRKFQGGHLVPEPYTGDYWPINNEPTGIDVLDNHVVIGWQDWNTFRGRIDILEFNYDSGPIL